MVLDSKIAAVRDAYGVRDLHDWQDITPHQVMAIDGVGPVTLDHLRLYLAGHDTTLKNDATPSYWKKNLTALRIAQQVADNDNTDVAPFTVLVDSMEQEPFEFAGLKSDAGRAVVVPTAWRSLGIRDGRFYQPMGDYSIDGYESVFHLERKSIEDCHGTILAFGGRRERFEHELQVLAGLPWSAVIVEGTLSQVVRSIKQRGEKPVEELRKIVYHSVIAYQQDYRVPWYFCESRRMAEVTAFRLMVRFWRKMKELKRKERIAS